MASHNQEHEIISNLEFSELDYLLIAEEQKVMVNESNHIPYAL
jgi:hypothetical protein